MEQYTSTVRKNISWLLSGNIIGRAVRSLVIIYAIITLSKTEFGAFSYLLGMATLITVLSDIGINSFLTKEVSRDESKRREYFSTVFFIKSSMLLVLGALFVLFSMFFVDVPGVVSLAFIMAGVFVFDSFRDFGSALARATDRMDIEGANHIITNFFIAAFGFYLIYTYGTGAAFGIAYLIGTGLGLLAIAWTLRSDIKKLFSHFNRSLVRGIISSSWPFGLWALMGTIMVNTDIVVIGLLSSVEAVAAYSAAQKIIQLLYLAPALISTSFFPTLSRISLDAVRFRNVLEDALSMIFMVAMPLTLGGVALGSEIIDIATQGRYPESIIPFTILASTMILVFPSILIGNAIFAQDKQKMFLKYVFLGIVGNIVLDILLIPILGIVGAAVATLINQLIITAYAWALMKKISYFEIFFRLKKIISASLIMLFVVFVFKGFEVNVILNVVLSGFAYVSILFVLREPSLKFIPFIGIRR